MNEKMKRRKFVKNGARGLLYFQIQLTENGKTRFMIMKKLAPEQKEKKELRNSKDIDRRPVAGF